MEPHDARSPYRDGLRAAAIVCFFAALALGACSVFAALGVYIVIGAGLVLSLVPPFAEAHAARILGARGYVFAAIAPISFVPLVARLADVATNESLLDTRVSLDQNGSNLLAMAFGTLVVGAPLVAFWWLAVGAVDRPRFDRAIAMSARTVLVIAAASIAGVAVRTWTTIQPHRWASRLPILEHVGTDDWRGMSISEMEAAMKEQYFLPRDRAFRAGGSRVELMQACYWNDCELWLRPQAADRFYRIEHASERADYTVRWDARHSVYLVQSPTLFRDVAVSSTGEVVPVHIAKIRDAVAPPAMWSLDAALGLVGAAVILRRGQRRRSAEEGRTWIEGRVEDEGAVVLVDGTRLPPCGIPARSSVAASGVDPGTATFRTQTEAKAEVILAGSLLARRRQAALEETIAAAWALSILMLTSAPLVVFFLL